ncbi:MAG: ThiF family adenylyltransferase [Acidobacteriota bacterium]|nr:ThiF family adenylyltransferase [Acidobacteriota bacterium]
MFTSPPGVTSPVTPGVTVDSQGLREDRYSRLRLIPWWDQNKIAAAKVLVVGAGALGNEILKNLALLGFREVVIVDLDRIEESNLSRAVLFRSSNLGQYKAAAAASGFEDLAVAGHARAIVGNIMHDCGLGLFAWADLILAGLDNREARLWINRSTWRMNRPWIDGAIEGINGVARVFLPGAPPCYECTLGEVDWQLLEQRMSCNLLLREASTEGKVPTTPTISSIIAGIQVQEAVKLLHAMPTLSGQGFVFEGLHHTSYRVNYTTNDDCMSHHTLERVISLPECSSEMRLADLWKRACDDLGSREVTIDFSRDVIHKLVCSGCGAEEEQFVPVGSLSFEQGRCPKDRQMRVVQTIHSFSGTEAYGQRSLNQLGLPLFDVFTARTENSEIGYLLAGDQREILGSAADSSE